MTDVIKSVYFVLCFKRYTQDYLTAINQISLDSSLLVVVNVLNYVKEAGCLVFVLAQFLNNRKSFGKGGTIESLLPVNMANLS